MNRYRVDASTPRETIEGWENVDASRPAPSEDADRARQRLERALADVLSCEHVLVLAGLGTSLSVLAVDGVKPLFPTMSGLWTKVKERVGDATFTATTKLVGLSGGVENIEELLSRCYMKRALEPSADVAPPTDSLSSFIKLAELVIRKECRHTLSPSSTTVHEDFLRRLAHRASRRPRVNLFTTNYDLCFETAASRIGLPVIDGFSFSSPPRFNTDVFDYDIVTNSSYSREPDFVPRLMRLFKLHGSVNWHPDESGISKNETSDSPVLIYPQFGKYAASYSPPFLEMMSRFQALLRQRSLGVLAVCCGFNDSHIAEPILAAIKSNSSMRAVICAPDLCEVDARSLTGNPSAKSAVERSDLLGQCARLIDGGDSRLTFFNTKFNDLVSLMPSFVAQTDAEQHEVRIRKLERDVRRIKGSSSDV